MFGSIKSNELKMSNEDYARSAAVLFSVLFPPNADINNVNSCLHLDM